MRKSYRSSTGTVVETSDFEVWLRSARSRRGKLPYRTIETSLNDGRWVLTTETTLPGGWMLCVVTDVSELGIELRDLRQERDKAMKSALSDELTGLSNRRYAMDFLQQKLGPNKAQAMAVAVIDIDHFKAVNDRFGHAGGDLVLRDFAARLAETAGRDDVVARIGGEEFLLVLQGARTVGADSVLRQLGDSLDTASPLPEAPEFRYSCSAGVALARPGETVGEVLRRADEALYQAKRAGRNRVVVTQRAGRPATGVPAQATPPERISGGGSPGRWARCGRTSLPRAAPGRRCRCPRPPRCRPRGRSCRADNPWWCRRRNSAARPRAGHRTASRRCR